MGNSHNALSVDLDDPVTDLMMISVNIMLMNALMMSTININAYRYHQITNIRNDHDQHLDDYQSLSLSLRELERSLP